MCESTRVSRKCAYVARQSCVCDCVYVCCEYESCGLLECKGARVCVCVCVRVDVRVCVCVCVVRACSVYLYIGV